MPKRRNEATAAELLSTWTDSDTAMQIVGTNLGDLRRRAPRPRDRPGRRDAAAQRVVRRAAEPRRRWRGRRAPDRRRLLRVSLAQGLRGRRAVPDQGTTIDIDAPSPYLARARRRAARTRPGAGARRGRRGTRRGTRGRAAADRRPGAAVGRIGAALRPGRPGRRGIDRRDDSDETRRPRGRRSGRSRRRRVHDTSAVASDRRARSSTSASRTRWLPTTKSSPTRKPTSRTSRDRTTSKWSAYALDTPGGPLSGDRVGACRPRGLTSSRCVPAVDVTTAVRPLGRRQPRGGPSRECCRPSRSETCDPTSCSVRPPVR